MIWIIQDENGELYKFDNFKDVLSWIDTNYVHIGVQFQKTPISRQLLEEIPGWDVFVFNTDVRVHNIDIDPFQKTIWVDLEGHPDQIKKVITRLYFLFEQYPVITGMEIASPTTSQDFTWTILIGKVPDPMVTVQFFLDLNWLLEEVLSKEGILSDNKPRITLNGQIIYSDPAWDNVISIKDTVITVRNFTLQYDQDKWETEDLVFLLDNALNNIVTRLLSYKPRKAKIKLLDPEYNNQYSTYLGTVLIRDVNPQ